MSSYPRPDLVIKHKDLATVLVKKIDSLTFENLCIVIIDYIAPFTRKMYLLQTSFGNHH